MKIRSLVLATALGMGPAAWIAPQAVAQPMWDVVKVNMPYTITLGKHTLPPGDYTIQQLHSEDSTVLLFYNDKGNKFETSAMTIKAVNNTDETPDKTSVSLHHIGDAYYMGKIFIQGKDYGYEFPLPRSVRSRESEMTSVSVPAQNSITTTAADTTNATTVDTSDEIVTAPPVVDTTPPPPPTPNPPVAAVAPPTPLEPPVATDTTPVTQVPVEDSANREKRPASDDSAPTMPATSADWLAMLLSGGTLSGAGMMLRRKR